MVAVSVIEFKQNRTVRKPNDKDQVFKLNFIAGFHVTNRFLYHASHFTERRMVFLLLSVRASVINLNYSVAFSQNN